MINDINIINATMVYPEGIKEGHIGILDGKINQVTIHKKDLNKSLREIDGNGYIIFPGMIDSHVHVKGGSFSYREDFTSASLAGLSSGVTTILEMPTCAKPASSYDRYMNRIREVKEDGKINIKLYGGAGHDNLEKIPKIAKAGAIGFKTFLMAPVKGREKEFYGLCTETYEDLLKVMASIEKTGLTLTVHCEDQKIISDRESHFKKEGRNGLKAFCESRPCESEIKSVQMVIDAARETKCRVIIAHASTPEAVEIVQKAKEEGLDIYIESCPHYLCFDEVQMEKYSVFARIKPPFRDRNRVDRLQDMYAKGLIDIIGSDHAPYTREEKLKNGHDIWNASDGLCSLEFTLLLLLNLVDEGNLSYEMIAKSFSENTAKIFKLNNKGRIEVGRDADLVFIKRAKEKRLININNLYAKCKNTAEIYKDIVTQYRVSKTMLLGNMVFEEGKIKIEG